MSDKEIKTDKKKKNTWGSLAKAALAIAGLVVVIATGGKVKGKI